MLTSTVEVKVNFPELRQTIQSAKGLQKMETMDGIHATFENFILLIRSSQTEPKVRINSEAKTKDKAEEGMERAKEFVKQVMER